MNQRAIVTVRWTTDINRVLHSRHRTLSAFSISDAEAAARFSLYAGKPVRIYAMPQKDALGHFAWDIVREDYPETDLAGNSTERFDGLIACADFLDLD
jgi:hypothetical protein